MDAQLVTPVESGERSDEFAALFDALLYAVSHDLKTPLLSISLGAELLAEAMPAADERSRLAFEAMQRGAQDMGRLLDALTLLSRARRRPLSDEPVVLDSLLPGVPDAKGVAVRVDARVISEVLAAFGAPPSRVLALDTAVMLTIPWPAGEPACEGAPLEALLAALGLRAGTLIGALAPLQVQLERQGGTLVAGNGSATLLLPRAVEATS